MLDATGNSDQSSQQESAGIIEQLNTQGPSKESYLVAVLVWGPDKSVLRSILGLKPDTPLRMLKPDRYVDEVYPRPRYSVPTPTPGAEYYATSLGAVQGVAYRVLMNLTSAFPQDPSLRRLTAIHQALKDRRAWSNNCKAVSWSGGEYGEYAVTIIITQLWLPEQVDIVEPYMAHLEASALGESLKEKLGTWREDFDREVFARLWIPAAVSHANQTPCVLTPEDEAFAESINANLELNKPFYPYSYAEGPRLQSGVKFNDWLVRAGYAVRDKRGLLRPRCRVAKAKQANMGPDPTAPGNEQIPFKVVEEMEKELEQSRKEA